MNHEEYRTALDALGMTQVSSAKFFGVNPRTSRHWALGECSVPHSVSKFLNLMIRLKISPGEVDNILARKK
jgi:hypothetical protein